MQNLGLWTVPCDAEINVTWTFGGKDIPVHPLDIVGPSSFTTPGTPDPNDHNCYGLWTPQDTLLQQFGVDAIFGMPFRMCSVLL
jgi:hypothetical protein